VYSTRNYMRSIDALDAYLLEGAQVIPDEGDGDGGYDDNDNDCLLYYHVIITPLQG
jgi:hypothetical protein